MPNLAILGADIHDGRRLHENAALLIDNGIVHGIVAADAVPDTFRSVYIDGGVIAPAFVDLQVNGGGGVLFNDDQSVEALQKIAQAHAGTGTGYILPTLITDTPEATERAIAAVKQAMDEGISGIVGIHLEGPHLAKSRKGAHEAGLIREMDRADLSQLLAVSDEMPAVFVTLAPETVTNADITTLADAGVIVSLGHTDASFDLAQSAISAGAISATHLFNAMSQLGNREPGVVGAALNSPNVYAGVIADGVHVHAASLSIALRAKAGQDRIYLVTDAMSTHGSDISEFTLNGRTIYRSGNRLTLADGTLAGAHVTMGEEISFLVRHCAVPLSQAIAMATYIPATVIGSADKFGSIQAGLPAKLVHLDAEFNVTSLF